MGDNGIDRFSDHPAPVRMFQRIEPAEVEMRNLESDDVTMRSQVVPGGGFGFEIGVTYEYAGRPCALRFTMERDAAESLRDRLDAALEADDRE